MNRMQLQGVIATRAVLLEYMRQLLLQRELLADKLQSHTGEQADFDRLRVLDEDVNDLSEAELALERVARRERP